MARLGTARQARPGKASCGEVGLGVAWQARPGMACGLVRCGAAWCGAGWCFRSVAIRGFDVFTVR